MNLEIVQPSFILTRQTLHELRSSLATISQAREAILATPAQKNDLPWLAMIDRNAKAMLKILDPITEGKSNAT